MINYDTLLPAIKHKQYRGNFMAFFNPAAPGNINLSITCRMLTHFQEPMNIRIEDGSSIEEIIRHYELCLQNLAVGNQFVNVVISGTLGNQQINNLQYNNMDDFRVFLEEHNFLQPQPIQAP